MLPLVSIAQLQWQGCDTVEMNVECRAKCLERNVGDPNGSKGLQMLDMSSTGQRDSL